MLCLPDSRMPVPDGSTYARTHRVHMHARTRPSCLLDPRTPGPVPMPAGSMHARVCARARWIHAHVRAHACWIHTCPCPCPMDPCTHWAHARMHWAHARTSHQVPTRAHSQGPHVCSFAGSSCPLACRVPTRTRSWGPHTRMHQAHAHVLTPGPHTLSPA